MFDIEFEDDDLPPLVPIEEADLSRLEEGEIRQQPQIPQMSPRPPRELRNRSVARSVYTKKQVSFSSLVECIDSDHRYQKTQDLDKDGTLFPPYEFQGDIN